jgi:ATPase subunit of ABC transporter with duplicated ATPase domains
MKIKLSKKQWQFIGKQAGWMKTAQHASNMTNSGTKIGHKIIIDLNDVVATERVMRAFDTSEFSGSIVFISAYRRPNSDNDIRVAIQLRDNVRSVMKRMPNRLVVEVENLVKGFGDRVLIDDLSFTLPRNGIVGVIGPNGAGKTTLFKTILGLEPADSGNVKIGETVKISYVDQSRGGIDPKKSLWEVVSDGLDFMKVGQVEMPSRAYVAAFGFKGPDQQKAAGVLSGGERNRLNLAMTLKQGGNLLLLDEPTNDLDVETLGSLENALLEFPGCAVVISHDRWFLDRITTHILAYEGDSKWFWFEGNFESYEANKIERLGPEAARPHRATYRKLTR